MSHCASDRKKRGTDDRTLQAPVGADGGRGRACTRIPEGRNPCLRSKSTSRCHIVLQIGGNAALTTVPFKHPWVLMVDADERVPASLKAEILAFVANPPLDVTLCF